MILIGRYDSPYLRRVGVSARPRGADPVDRPALSGDTLLWLTAHDGGAAPHRPSGQPQTGAAADAGDGAGGLGPKAEDQPPGAAAPDLSLPVARAADRFAFARRGRPLLGHPGNAGDDRIPFVGSRYSAKSRSRNLPSSRNSAA